MPSNHESYFKQLDEQLEHAITVASRARSQGPDPTQQVEIPVAEDMADRVENLLEIDGLAKRIRSLEDELDREAAALALAKDFAEGRVGTYDSRAEIIEAAVRTAVALLTEGVVAAPIEGIDRVEIRPNDDGTEYVRVYYAGPIRSAGGTAQALSVLVADYVRSLLGIEPYTYRPEEIERYAEEVTLYDDEVGLQYSPSKDEIRYIAKHCPIMLDGEATSDDEVSGYRNLERMDTNRARGGLCLVMAEGIALKAPKIQRYTQELEEVDWPWLDDLITGTHGNNADSQSAPEQPDVSPTDTTDQADLKPTDKYLRDLIAGRPVFSHPSEPGGFRLRYGRVRNGGFATAGIHPATMRIVDDFLATGTQLKTERPGKAAGVVPVDSIDGPTVKLMNGEVRRIDDPAEAQEIRNGVESILDLGEFLVPYGEFVENNHRLAPASYVVEWWRQDLMASGADIQALEDNPQIDLENPTPELALELAESHDVPLHPEFTYLWHDVAPSAIETLAAAIETDEWSVDPDTSKLTIPYEAKLAEILETLLVEHRQDDDRIVISNGSILLRTLGFTPDGNRNWTSLSSTVKSAENAIPGLNEIAPFEIRERAPTRIGCRMGRPEKSETRELSPAVHTLFPIGEAGGDQRDIAAAAQYTEDMQDAPGHIEVETARRSCQNCGTTTYRTRCPTCESVTEVEHWCPDCDIRIDQAESTEASCPRCGGSATSIDRNAIDVHTAYRDALEAVEERENAFEMLKGVKGLTSESKTPEPLEKGILRAKHGISVFKDGTIRYDMTDLPVTSVRPAEIDVSIDTLRELGYEEDIHGNSLQYDDQLIGLRVQDIILSDGAAEHLVQVANFVDELLESVYDTEPFYEVDERSDLIGELVFGLAPHTSAAVVGRITGFTSASVGYAHPYFHAAKRRNCFHPDTVIRYVDESGTSQEQRIKEFVEARLTDPRTDDVGTLIQELDGNITVPSIDSNGLEQSQPIDAVSKHPAPDHLIHIETDHGRSIRVTHDHTMIRWKNGLEQCSAMQLEAGDSIPVYASSDERTSVDGAVMADGGPPHLDQVSDVTIIKPAIDHTYCLTVCDTHSLVANEMFVKQCDGDEDSVMLLMDGLLNFSKSYLPSNRGGSVVEDSRLIAVDPDDRIRFLSFDEFWKSLDQPVEVDGKFRKKTCPTGAWQTYAFGDDEHSSLQPIEKAIRYRADSEEAMLRVETTAGRTLSITKHHSLFRYNEGIEAIPGAELTVGDQIVAPGSLSIDSEQAHIDLADLPSGGSLTEISPDGGTIDTAAGNESTSPTLNDPMSRFIDVDTEFAWLLGVICGDEQFSLQAPVIHPPNAALREKIVKTVQAVFDIAPSEINSGTNEVRFPAIIAELFDSLGALSTDDPALRLQAIPDCILKASAPIITEFLNGIIIGSSDTDATTHFTSYRYRTNSRDVKDGLVYLFHRLGIVATIETESASSKSAGPTYTISANGTDTDRGNSSSQATKDDPEGVTHDYTGELSLLTVTEIEQIEYDGYLYDLQVGGDPVFTANWLFAHNSMDAPLVMSSRIDPTEIDDEAHNVDSVTAYEREFYEATRDLASPDKVDVNLAGDLLETDHRLGPFHHTHDTSDIALGPRLSAYKTLGSMEEKLQAQLRLARQLRAVDETDVAERIIEYHFLPDLLGNLRAFTRQETRCLDCGTKYRRPPLTGSCPECGGTVNLTVHEGSVNKYLETALEIASDYGASEYTVQRLQLLDKTLESLFEDDTNRQSGIADFM